MNSVAGTLWRLPYGVGELYHSISRLSIVHLYKHLSSLYMQFFKMVGDNPLPS
jgi:hypothetical protein